MLNRKTEKILTNCIIENKENVYRLAYSYVKNNEDALDIVQDSIYKAMNNLELDKVNQILITLPMLFKDEQYIERISQNIKEQMIAQMKADPDKVYWIPESGDELSTEMFTSISKDQSFYINHDGKLVIVFNEYDVAPGFMGSVAFVIPTEVIAGDLVSQKYIQ
jgi:hypothetical protein